MVIEIDEGIEALPEQIGDVDQKILTSFVQNIEADEFRGSQIDLARVIENRSGIKVRKIGSVGSYSSVSIRGKSSNQVMVYLDGTLLNNASGGSVDLSLIPTNQIARVEIYKDVVPIEFSQASNGGVINIITHRTKQEKSAKINVSAGSNRTIKADFSFFSHFDRWQIVVSGGHVESKNDFQFIDENGTFQNPNDDEVSHRNNNELNQQNLLLKANYKINGNRSLVYQGEIKRKVKNIPTINNSSSADTDLEQTGKNVQLTYLDKKFLTKNLESKISAKISNKSTLFDDDKGKILGLPTVLKFDINQLEFGAYFKYRFMGNEYIFNGDFRRESLVRDNTKDNLIASSNRRQTVSTAIQGNWLFLDKKLILSPAARAFISADKFNGEIEENGVKKFQKLEKLYHTISPQFGLRYQLSDNSAYKFNIGRYYRLPNYIELFGTNGFVGSNDSLRPEKGTNIDIGFETNRYFPSEYLTRMQWSVSFFHSIIDDVIVYYYNARGEGKPSNVNDSSISGVENNINIELFYNSELSFNTTLQLPLNKSDPDDTDLLAGRPLWIHVSNLHYDGNNFQVFVEHQWESYYYFDSEQRLPSNGKFIFNTGFEYSLQNFNFSLEVNNIFNELSKDYYYQVSPGRMIYFTTGFTFK